MRIAALIATRYRVAECIESIRSLYQTARRPEALEVLVRVDDDQAAAVAEILAGLALPTVEPALPAPTSARWRVLVVTGPRYTYWGMHHYFEELARLSTADWVLLWNDDATMGTTDWDTVIDDRDAALPWVIAPRPEGGGAPNHSAFPLVSRGFLDTVARPFAKHACCDSYCCDVGIKADIYVGATWNWHHRLLQDQAHCEKEIHRAALLTDYWGEGLNAMMDADVAAIRERLNR